MKINQNYESKFNICVEAENEAVHGSCLRKPRARLSFPLTTSVRPTAGKKIDLYADDGYNFCNYYILNSANKQDLSGEKDCQ